MSTVKAGDELARIVDAQSCISTATQESVCWFPAWAGGTEMNKEPLQLEAGQTAIAIIAEGLCFRVTHDGWSLRISSDEPLAIRPEKNGAVRVITLAGIKNGGE